jgi:methionine-gamma-lyase
MSDKHDREPLDESRLSIESKAIHVGQHPDPAYGAVAPPIYQTSTFAFDSPDQGARRFAGSEGGYIYSRMANPTTQRLEECVAALEGGVGALAAASGMAAVSISLLAHLRAGDHMVGTDCVYGPTRLLAEEELSRLGIESSFVNTADAGAIERAWRPNTKMLYLETPANPTLKLADVAAGAGFAHDRGAVVVCDNTFASPVLQRPLDLGADVVLHSTTKYINGHADVVGGIVIARKPEHLARMLRVRSYYGGSMDPHQSWLVLRGLKTLPMRVKTAQDNAMRLATFLEGHRAVERVHYPGLASHPQHALAEAQMDGPGSMIAIELVGGRDAGVELLESTQLFTLAVSLGGVESLIEHPASMTHAGLPDQELREAGISPGLVRLAIGCEGYQDLEDDLRGALDRIA